MIVSTCNAGMIEEWLTIPLSSWLTTHWSLRIIDLVMVSSLVNGYKL